VGELVTARRLRQVTVFGLISIATTVLDFGLFNILIRVDALPVVSANTIGYSAGIVASYILNKKLTFEGGGRDSRTHEFALFVAINLFGLVLNNVAVGVTDSLYPNAPVVLNASKLGAGMATWALKFIAFERWVYPAREKSDGEPPAF
jgi:putative flippase GtrA